MFDHPLGKHMEPQEDVPARDSGFDQRFSSFGCVAWPMRGDWLRLLL